MRRRQSYSDAFNKQFEHETEKYRKIKLLSILVYYYNCFHHRHQFSFSEKTTCILNIHVMYPLGPNQLYVASKKLTA